MVLQPKSALLALAFVTLGWILPCLGQTSLGQTSLSQTTAPSPAPSPASGSISGTIVDPSGALVAGARIKLTLTATDQTQSPSQDAVTGDDGQFSFATISPGAFQLTVTATGFASQTSSGVLLAGEVHTVPQIALAVAENVTDVQVALSRVEVAEAQIKDEEKQRVLGIIPNFYVSYDPHPVPLTSKQKFELAWRTTVDPFTFAVIGGIAGAQQAQNAFSGYGQGAQGYGKRYGAAYADVAVGTFLGGAILPSLLRQDPRYFYKGTGTVRSRTLYALANAVICKGDNGHWQANYSNILGNLAAGGISNLYYPSQNRNGAALTFENSLIGIGATAAANIFEEFIMKKLTPNVNHDHAKP
jgi:hypothetical protein